MRLTPKGFRRFKSSRLRNQKDTTQQFRLRYAIIHWKFENQLKYKLRYIEYRRKITEMSTSDKTSLNNYWLIQRDGLQGWGNSLIDRQIEKRVRRQEGYKILELGASSGEHLSFVQREPIWKSYTCLDINPGITNPKMYQHIIANESPSYQRIEFVKANAENLPFEDSTFDIVVATCLLAHVDHSELVLQEARRVTKNKGQLVIGLPCDPGLVNRVIKFIVTFPKMKRLGISDPKLTYARGHKNPISNLIVFIKHIFCQDKIKLRYYPLKIQSWNCNLFVIFDCTLNKS
jgi:ubiquinone/menaquinone biosynthesis C-methylase UbiE